MGTKRSTTVLTAITVVLAGLAAAPVAADPRPAKTQAHGTFIVRCTYDHSARNDPIVHMGMRGMSHLHDFFGNRSTDADSTRASLMAAATTCGVRGDRSAYWAPAVRYDGRKVTPTAVLAYYVQTGADTPALLPAGLKIVAGGSKGTTYFTCGRLGMIRGFKWHDPKRMGHCGAKEHAVIGVRFPDCWDGTHLDSADHRSHMAYSVAHVCPADHPVQVPRVVLNFLYPNAPAGATATLASGGLDTAHADLFSAWQRPALQMLVDHCMGATRRLCKHTATIVRRSRLSGRTAT